MLKNKVNKFLIISLVVEMILGCLLHFTFSWSGKNPIVGVFSAVNESTWEHVKLIFFPGLLMSIIGYFYFRNTDKNYLCAKVKGIILGGLFIIVFFYTYSGVLGKSMDLINIASFFVAVIIEEYVTYKNIYKEKKSTCMPLFVMIMLTLLFVLFTFCPLHIGLFKDPVIETYGYFNE